MAGQTVEKARQADGTYRTDIRVSDPRGGGHWYKLVTDGDDPPNYEYTGSSDRR